MRHLWLLPLLFVLPAHAEFEVRAHYGTLQAKPSGFNDQAEDSVANAPDLESPTGYGADALFAPPVLPLVFGLRYETFGAKKSGPGKISGANVNTTGEFTGTRTSLLVGYRVLSLPVGYAGLLVHYALAQKMKHEFKSVNGGGSTHTDTFDFKMQTGFGLAAEGGLRFKHLTVGAEAGYTLVKAKNASDDVGVVLDHDMNEVKLDLSGIYFKVLLGARF